MVSRSKSGKEVIDAMEQLFSEYTSPASKPRSGLLSKSLSSKEAAKHPVSEVERIKELWQRAKFELHAKSRELAKLKALMSHKSWEDQILDETTAEKDRLHDRVRDLQQELELCRQHLEAARKENKRWAMSYDRLSEDLSRSRNECNGRQSKLSDVEAENFKLKTIIRDLENAKQEMLSRSIRDICQHDEDVRYQSDTIHQQKQKIVDLEAELGKLRNLHNQAQAELKMLKQDQEAEKVLLQTHKLNNPQANSDSRTDAQRNHELSNLKLRLKHLQVDNTRLLELLKSTGVFSTFVELCNDSPETDGCAYVRKLDPKDGHKDDEALRQELLALQKSYASDMTCPCSKAGQPDPKSESLDWVPKEALKVSAYFKANHLPHVSADVIGSFLRTLNKIWQHREHKKIQRLKAQHQTRLRDLKRQQRQNLPYEQVVRSQSPAKSRPKPITKRFGAASNDLKKRFHILSSSEPALNAYQSLDLDSPGATEALLLALEELSAELRVKKDNVNNLSQRLDGVSQEKLHAVLTGIHKKVSKTAAHVIGRIRQCSRRVATLETRDPDYSILLFRAYNAMMEDIELSINALEEHSQKNLLTDEPIYNTTEAKC